MNKNQINRIRKIDKQFDTEFSGYIRLIDPEKIKLEVMLDNNSTDMNAIKDQLENIENYNVDIQILRIRHGKELSEILTLEQMSKLHNERKNIFRMMERIMMI